ncbi:hypothetical protein HZF08_03140 [Paenibacillus sp. CGMCC 1.16610]|uniref:Immunity protein 30 domain-containing protein n=2 Tax=Paenibacillus TaxID=44249 RepID=A0ABW9UER4_9BACL|nr:hypothetical protein [Paenibacillus anseongense]MBA2937287.1 hypothetical protein [Paenibacillus sp. CGMCC 1.16610]MVQ36345.1 hypothetical protein [Paenibacillus anseongense]
MWQTIYNKANNQTTREEIDELLSSLEDGICNLTDDEIIIKVGRYIPSQGCEGAVHGYLEMLAAVSPFRTNITHNLLVIALQPIYYMGFEETERLCQYIAAVAREGRNLNNSQQKVLADLATQKTLIESAFTTMLKLEKLYQ